MKKNRLHILTAFFSIILLTLLSFGASAEDAPTEDYLTKTVDYVEYHLYETDGEKVAVAYKFVGNKEVTELNILSEVDGYKVKSVDEELKDNYIQGFKLWNKDKSFLIDTCQACQAKFKKVLDEFGVKYQN